MTLQEQLQSFISQYTGKTGIGDTPQNKGQCVGLVEVWINVLGLPHDWGNAKDLLTNADSNSFDVIYNNPNDTNQFPSLGDIMVWGSSWGNGYGHTGIVVTANGTSFTTFEQNDITANDPNGACETLSHNYSGVLGWLHPKQPVQATQPQPQPDQQAIIDDLRTARDANWNLYQSEVAKNKALTDQITQLQQEVNSLNGQVTQLTNTNTQLKINVSQVEKDNQDLLTKMADMQKNDSIAIDEGLKAESDLKDATQELQSLQEALGATDTSTPAMLSAVSDLKDTIDQQQKTQEKTANNAWLFLQQFFAGLAKKKS